MWRIWDWEYALMYRVESVVLRMGRRISCVLHPEMYIYVHNLLWACASNRLRVVNGVHLNQCWTITYIRKTLFSLIMVASIISHVITDTTKELSRILSHSVCTDSWFALAR